MGHPLTPHPAMLASPPAPFWRRLARVLSLVRYRFFLYAGLIPYGLGAAWAYRLTGRVDPGLFAAGMAGVVLAVVGVEAFNEYFDSRLGTDRVFNPADLPPMADWVLWLGCAAFGGALAIGLALALRVGWMILAYVAVGGLAAAFYVGPPIRWAYRGLGEAMIALSYGPCMVLGTLALLTGRFDWGGLVASLLPGLLIMALAVVNAIPDFHQDRLVGKRNLCVRLGRDRAVTLYLALAAAGLAVVPLGVAAGLLPRLGLITLVTVPLLIGSGQVAYATCHTPARFVPAIRRIVACYGAATLLFTLAVVAQSVWERR